MHLLAGGDAEGVSAAAGTQVGLVVGRSVGNSVVRHRVSRQLRHLLRERLDGFGAGARVVIRARPSAAGRTSALLGDDLDRALRKLGASA